MQISLGRVTPAGPGFPARATQNRPDPSEQFYVHAYSIQRLKSDSGDIYVSLSPTDNRASLSLILAILDKNFPGWSAGVTNEVNGLDMSKVYIDIDSAGDSVIIAALVS